MDKFFEMLLATVMALLVVTAAWCVYRSITAASRPPQPGDMAEPRLSMCKNECEAAGGRWTYTETEMNDKCTCTQGR